MDLFRRLQNYNKDGIWSNYALSSIMPSYLEGHLLNIPKLRRFIQMLTIILS